MMDERIDPHEMMRLRDMLDAAGVEHRTNDYEPPIPFMESRMEYHTTSIDWDTLGDEDIVGFSCILSPFSYGHQDGLLELWAQGMDEPVGYLSADDVMDRLREMGLA